MNVECKKTSDIIYAMIFWFALLGALIYPFIMGLQYYFFVIMFYIFSYSTIIKHLKVRIFPFQDEFISKYKKTFIFKLLYGNIAYKEGSIKLMSFHQCRGMFYYLLILSCLLSFISLANNRYSENDAIIDDGYIIKVIKRRGINICSKNIIIFKGKDNLEKKFYTSLEYKELSNVNLNDIFRIKIMNSKNSIVHSCNKYSSIVSINNENFKISIITDIHNKAYDLLLVVSFIVFFVSILFFISICSSYKERNRIS